MKVLELESAQTTERAAAARDRLGPSGLRPFFHSVRAPCVFALRHTGGHLFVYSRCVSPTLTLCDAPLQTHSRYGLLPHRTLVEHSSLYTIRTTIVDNVTTCSILVSLIYCNWGDETRVSCKDSCVGTADPINRQLADQSRRGGPRRPIPAH